MTRWQFDRLARKVWAHSTGLTLAEVRALLFAQLLAERRNR